MGNIKTLQQKAEHFQSHMGAMMLMVCRNITDEELQEIAKRKWACVFTSRTDLDVLSLFEADRFTREIPPNPMELLNNADGLSFLPVMEENMFMPGTYVANNDMFHCIQMLLQDGLNRLVVVGYDYAYNDYRGDVDLVSPFLARQSVPTGSIEFWGMSDQTFRAGIERSGFTANPEKLSDLIQYMTDQVQQDVAALDTPYYFFADGKVVSSPLGLVLTDDNRMGVLTQRQVELIRPNGKYDCQMWFRNFLEHSSSVGNGYAPQWYAYSSRLRFSVKRDREAPLLALVQLLLNGHKLGGKNLDEKEVGSVVLAGDPGSGKSVTLASLAYQVFQQRIHPVIFITGKIRKQQLVDLLEGVEKACSDRYPRILVVWDCSAYRPQMQDQLEMINHLKGRFHRFVMVYSAYSTLEDEDATHLHYSYSEEKGFHRSAEDSVMYVTDRDNRLDYCFELKRELSRDEQENLWSKFKEHSAIDPARLKEWRQKLKDEDDLFEICYKMINIIRANYESHLDTEHNVVHSYVQKELEHILGDSIDERSELTEWQRQLLEMKELLADSGMTLEDMDMGDLDDFDDQDPEDEENGEEESVHDRLRKVDTHIAMFSRFEHMEVPYNYIKHLLITGKAGWNNVAYSTDSDEDRIFRLMTTKIPWIRCGRNERGDFTCSFRKPLEADIFLRNQGVTPKIQVDILFDMLEYYRQSLVNHTPISPLFVINLGKLLRNMGPNTRHPAYQRGGNRYAEYEQISEAMREKIPQKLSDICKAGTYVDPHFVCDYITFVREYNTPKNNNGTVTPEGLAALEAAADIALEYITLERNKDVAKNIQTQRRDKGGHRYANGILETLRTEWVQCQRWICQYWIEYRANTPRNEWCPEALEWNAERFNREYESIFNHMDAVLNSNPNKGMYYNVLFQSFLMMEKQFTDEVRNDYLLKLMPHVDHCGTYRLEHNNSESAPMMRTRARQITELIDKFEFSLGTLLDFDEGMQKPGFKEEAKHAKQLAEYERALKINDPTILLLACRRELYHAGVLQKPDKLGGKDLVTNEMLSACKAVRSYLDRHYTCVKTSSYGTWLLLTAAWMEYSGGNIISDNELRSSALTYEQWQNIYRYSRDHCILADVLAKSDACLLYVLSTFYTTDSFNASKSVLDEWTSPLENNGGNRRKHPYRLCSIGSDGRTDTPIVYSAEIVQQDQNTSVEVQMGERFKKTMILSTLGIGKMPQIGSVLKVNIGLGYAGFTAYAVPNKR